MTTEVAYIGADGNPRLMPEGMGEKLGLERAAVQTPPELQEGGDGTGSEDSQSDPAADKALIQQLQDDKQQLQNDIVERDNTIAERDKTVADLEKKLAKSKEELTSTKKELRALTTLQQAADSKKGDDEKPADDSKPNEEPKGSGTATPTGQQ